MEKMAERMREMVVERERLVGEMEAMRAMYVENEGRLEKELREWQRVAQEERIKSDRRGGEIERQAETRQELLSLEIERLKEELE